MMKTKKQDKNSGYNVDTNTHFIFSQVFFLPISLILLNPDQHNNSKKLIRLSN